MLITKYATKCAEIRKSHAVNDKDGAKQFNAVSFRNYMMETEDGNPKMTKLETDSKSYFTEATSTQDSKKNR